MHQGCHVSLNVRQKFEQSWIFRTPRHLSANIPIHLFYPPPKPQYPVVPLPVCHLGMVCGCENYILLSRHEATCRDKLLNGIKTRESPGISKHTVSLSRTEFNNVRMNVTGWSTYHHFVVRGTVVINVLVPSNMIESAVISIHMGGTLKESRTGITS